MQIPYDCFYDGVLRYLSLCETPAIAALYQKIKTYVLDLSRGYNNKKLLFAPCGDIVWEESEYIALCLREHLDEFYDAMRLYLASIGFEREILEDLLCYQRQILRMPGVAESRCELRYDVHGFLHDAYRNDYHAPRPRRHTLILRDSAPCPDWQTFGKQVVWYGKMGWGSYKDSVEIIDAPEQETKNGSVAK